MYADDVVLLGKFVAGLNTRLGQWRQTFFYKNMYRFANNQRHVYLVISILKNATSPSLNLNDFD